jgi:hypothetical protein
MLALLILSLASPALAEVASAPTYACELAAVVSGQLPKVYSGDLRLVGSGTLSCKGKGVPAVNEKVSVRLHGGSTSFDFSRFKSLSLTSPQVENVHSPSELFGAFQLGASDKGLHATRIMWGHPGAAMELSLSGENAAEGSKALTGGSLMIEP